MVFTIFLLPWRPVYFFSDIYIKNKINFCDVAAGVLLCEEAGGLAMDFSGDVITKCSKNIIVCNQYLKNEILEKIELI